MKKYKLLKDRSIQWKGRTLYRIQSLRDQNRLGYWNSSTIGSAIQKAIRLIDDDISGRKRL